MSYAPLYGLFGTVVGSTLGGQLQQSQPGYTQQQLAQAQQQVCMSQLQQAQFQQQALINAYRSKSVFVPITQDEVDMAEAKYEVDKLSPTIKGWGW